MWKDIVFFDSHFNNNDNNDNNNNNNNNKNKSNNCNIIVWILQKLVTMYSKSAPASIESLWNVYVIW